MPVSYNLIQLILHRFRQPSPTVNLVKYPGLSKRRSTLWHSKTHHESPGPHQIHPQLMISNLPFDILLEIFFHLDVKAVVALSQVSRILYSIADSRAIWMNIARQLLYRCKPLVVKGFPSLRELSTQQLQDAIKLSTRLERNWCHRHPRMTSSSVIVFDFPMVEMLCSIVKFKQYLLCPTRDGRVITWDLAKKEHAITYTRGNDRDLDNAPFGLFSGRVDYQTRSLYYFCVHTATLTDISFYVLRIQFPESDSSKDIAFSPVATFSVPYPSIIDMYILDTEKRTICAIYLSPSKNIGFHIIFDWNSHMSTFVDTGIPFVFRKTVVVAHLAGDSDTLVVRVESCGKERLKSYSLNALLCSISGRKSRTTASSNTAILKENSYNWNTVEYASEPHSLVVDPFTAPYRVWTLHPWWPAPTGVPKRTSTIVLYVHTPDIDLDVPPNTSSRQWIVTQHFATETGPCSRARCVIPLRDPAPVRRGASDGLPMLGIAFGHVVWIERIRTWRGPRRVRRRVAKLATFPEPLEDARNTGVVADAIRSSYPTVRNLDIPERILKVACHLIVDPSSASVSVTTETNVLYTYYYA